MLKAEAKQKVRVVSDLKKENEKGPHWQAKKEIQLSSENDCEKSCLSYNRMSNIFDLEVDSSKISKRSPCHKEQNDIGYKRNVSQSFYQKERSRNVNNTIIRGCMLRGRMPKIDDSKSSILKVLFFKGEARRSISDTLFHCRKVIHETTFVTSLNPVWNSSFLVHLPIRNDDYRSNGYLQFILYCIKGSMSQKIFVGQHTVKLNDSCVEGRPERWSLHRWDGKTKIDNAEIEAVIEVFWPIHSHLVSRET